MTLSPGLRLRLPSGNVVILVAREGREWRCVFVEGSSQRGEVELSAAWLKKWGMRV